MLVYNKQKKEFLEDVLSNNIEKIILDFFQKKLERTTQKTEIDSWKNSMMYMKNILEDIEIPDDSWVAIEYRIPQTGKRIDFVITWKDENEKEHVIIVELKQRQEAKLTDKDGLVITRFKSGEVETSHPSYQAWSYAALLEWFNETVYTENIQLNPCAYLHNYDIDDGVLNNEFYSDYIKKAPIFLRHDVFKLRTFIKKFVKYWDKNNIMYRIDHGRIKPSKHLADSMASMLKGNKEFIMIDDQKVVYENAIALAKRSDTNNKNVLIVEGWPWTGKSVVAINLLVELTKLWLVSKYVTKNSAPRTVYHSKLTGSMRQTEIWNLFSGSGAFTNNESNAFDVLIVDEAHRLNAKSGMFSNLGENQIMEIIDTAKFSIFFIDEDQKVTLKDIWRKDEIKDRAKKLWVRVNELILSSQFRCDWSDWYLAWLDDTLQIRETANQDLEKHWYDFQIMSSPNELRDIIFEKNKKNNKARLVAWYCRDWISKKDRNAFDIVFSKYNFGMKRNLAMDGMLRILKPESVSEVWCIHTCQWLEMDYVWVIVWDDLVVREWHILTNPENRAKTDMSLKWYKKLLREKNENITDRVDKIIKNTYRTLMTRWQKWCYVYFVDKETEDYFRSRM